MNLPRTGALFCVTWAGTVVLETTWQRDRRVDVDLR
jgi:hypothetical protein